MVPFLTTVYSVWDKEELPGVKVRNRAGAWVTEDQVEISELDTEIYTMKLSEFYLTLWLFYPP